MLLSFRLHTGELYACLVVSHTILVALHPQTLKLAHAKRTLGEEKIPTQ